MLTDSQVSFFNSFGYVFAPELFSSSEIEKITNVSDSFMKELREGEEIDPEKGQSEDRFVERSEYLTQIVAEDRIYESARKILGERFLWAGSEGHITVNSTHQWHPDRPGDTEEVSYTRLKVNIYLDPIRSESGCLRVIPGSHRWPLHGEIEPERFHQVEDTVRPFDVPGEKMPSVLLESNPGDVIFFNQSLWHSIFNGWAGRRYIALKFAANPQTDTHLASLKYYGNSKMFAPDPAWVGSASDRIQSMVGRLPKLGEKPVSDFLPIRPDR